MNIRVLVQVNPEEMFKAMVDAITEQLEKGLEDIGGQIERRAKRKAPTDTGALRRSITAQREGLTEKVGSNLHYAPYVEFGTRPHWPPVEPIREWVWRNRGKFGITGRGKKANKEVDRVTFLVRAKIAKRGTAPRRYLRDALEEVKPRIAKVLAYYVRRAELKK
ncbi:phage protein, HK97 gp10 family [Thermanaeromonas toyohensis ToBE]|uniref:Phage protein, HK97 gp10 family n=1 Tax=Thermanaeromonas toyohensis ToBE TaxID=698762 RepID=A0A1W1VXY6_9FIRM|nr:HK97-gp10 family putative phage morphogenesis protein [Thermanaeromonas toyohensis]SMB97951.1 phage protein, HK97 gp10 family [Thermanaeromonas toyohensis ToBE]